MANNQSAFSDSESDDDDWFYESIRRYSDLHMYKLSKFVSSFDVSSDKIVVAGKSSSNCYHEMSIYKMPSRLLAATPQEEGMSNERDFSLVAGTTNHSSQFIQVRFFNSEIVTLQDDGNLSRWRIEPDTDLIKKVESLHTGNDARSFTFLLDSMIGLILETQLKLISLPVKLEPTICPVQARFISVLTDSSYVSIDVTGQVLIRDLANSEKVLAITSEKEKIEISDKMSCLVMNKNILCVSLEDRSLIFAALKFDENAQNSSRLISIGQSKIPLPKSVDDTISGLKLIWIVDPQLIIISGTKIHVCRVQCDFQNPNSIQLELIFSHDGHRHSVLDCGPHPTIANLFFSVDVNKNLHAWQFITQ